MQAVTDKDFAQEVLEAKLPVLVDFWAQWCMPCQAALPVLEELAKEYEGRAKLVKVNVDENSKTAEKYQIMSIPTLVVFKNGQEIKRQIGFPGKEGYKKLIQSLIQ